MRKIALTFVVLAISACRGPDKTAYLSDPILRDLQQQESKAKSDLATAGAAVNEAKEALQAALPQTGQASAAASRYWASIEKRDAAQQRHNFLALATESRKKVASKAYLRAFQSGGEWPNQAEYSEYKAIQEANQRPRTWSAERRIKEAHLAQKTSISNLQSATKQPN